MVEAFAKILEKKVLEKRETKREERTRINGQKTNNSLVDAHTSDSDWQLLFSVQIFSINESLIY